MKSALRVVVGSAAMMAMLASSAPAVEVYAVSDYSSPQDAIDAAAFAGGGEVRFACGTTTLSSPLVLSTQGVTLDGCGPQGTILSASFATGDIIRIGNPAASYNYCGSVTNLSIRSSVTRTSGFAIAINGCQKGELKNLDISTQGGGGIRFGDLTTVPESLAAIVFVSDITMYIEGPFTGIQIDSSAERHFDHIWIEGNQNPSSRGIVINRSGGDWFNDIDVVHLGIGVALTPGPSQLVAWGNFNNVLADTNVSHGFLFGGSGSGSIFGISCVRCWSSSNGYVNGVNHDTNASGIRVERGNGLSFSESRLLNNGGHGFDILSGAADVEINGGVVSGNCIATPECTAGSRNGINFAPISGVRVLGVRSGQTFGGPTKQGYGIFLSAGSNNFNIAHNDFRGNSVAGSGIFNGAGTGATKIVQFNN